MKNFLTYFFSCILILASFFSNAQETKAPAANKATGAEQSRTIDSLLNVLKTLTPSSSDLNPTIEGESLGLYADSTKINTLNELSKQYSKIGDYEQALKCAQKARQQGEFLVSIYGDTKGGFVLKNGIATALINIGLVDVNRGNYESGLQNYLKALKINEEIANQKGIANCYNNIGVIYWHQGNYEKALEYHLKSMKIAESMGDKNAITKSLINIGNIYAEQNNHEKALKFFFDALKMNEAAGNKSYQAMILNNLGNVFTNLNNYTQAADYHLKALKIKEELGDINGIANSWTNLGNIYLKQAVSDITKKSLGILNKKAVECYLKSFTINQKIGNTLGVAKGYMNIANVYQLQGKLTEAFDNTLKSLSLCSEIGHKEGMKVAYSTLSDLLEKKGDYKKALEYKKRLSDMKDTLLNEQSSKQMAEMNARYDSEKKDKEIQLLNKENESQTRMAAAEKRKQLVILFSVSGFSILLMGFAMIIYRSFRQKNLLNTELEKSHKSIEQKNSKIIDSITYAQLIQQSILLEESEMHQFLPDSFIYYQPKDIVSGDFYWCSKIDDVIVLAAIDCTGHGIPGAFMSMIGNTLLNQIVNEKHITKPSEILRLLNIGVYEALHQQKGGILSHDGMDMALCRIDNKNGEIQYAGAQNPLYVVFENNIEVIKADVYTIGGGSVFTKADPRKRTYTNHIIPIKKGMGIYLFSDGYMDQFGGKDRKKFGIQQFKDIVLNNQHLEMQQQKAKISEAFDDWKGASPQIDDVLVMGLRL